MIADAPLPDLNQLDAAALRALVIRQHEFVIEQGYEMGRPSVIHLYMTMLGGKLSAASIGGEAVIFSEGTFEA